MRLDSWVFDAYSEWLQSPVAETMKNQNGIILFFHLLGCDTLGHAKKPHSRYLKFVLDFVVAVFKDFFSKKKILESENMWKI